MNILLVNNNPVVEKLVTLSAAKIGASITCVDELEKIEQTSYDLLMVDDEIYSDEFFNTLDATITYKTSLYIESKDSSFIDTFKYELKKPFLPTDLVELLTNIVSDLASINNDSIKEIQDHEDIIEEIPQDLIIQDHELDSLPELDELHERTNDEINNLDTLELDDLNNLDKGMDKTSSLILDEDDVQEVQQLLEDTDKENESIISDTVEDDILDIKEIPLEIEDTNENEQTQDNETSDDILELEEIPEIKENKNKNEEENEEKLEFENNLGEEEIIKVEESSEAQEPEKPEESLLIEQDQKMNDEDINEEEIKQKDEVVESTHDADALIDNIEDNIKHEVSKLNADDLNANITEDVLDDLDELSLIDEDTLKMAIGEEDAMTTKAKEISQQEDLDMQDKQREKHNGTKALKALLKALDDDDIVASLDGMNINISISIGQK